MNAIAHRALLYLPRELYLWHLAFRLSIAMLLLVVAILYFLAWLTGVGWIDRMEVERFSAALRQLQPSGELTISGNLNGKEVRGLKKVVAVTPFWISVRRPNDDNVFVVRLATMKSKLEFLRTVRHIRVGDTVLWGS